jgi:hypothetical protein
MLVNYHQALGMKYSESTARNDIADAERLFGTVNPEALIYNMNIAIDTVNSSLRHAEATQKHMAVAKLGTTLHKMVQDQMKWALQVLESRRKPNVIQIVVDEKLLGIQLDPNLDKRMTAWREKRLASGKGVPDFKDALFTEFNDETCPDDGSLE